jgi:hypothetical protein
MRVFFISLENVTRRKNGKKEFHQNIEFLDWLKLLLHRYYRKKRVLSNKLVSFSFSFVNCNKRHHKKREKFLKQKW